MVYPCPVYDSCVVGITVFLNVGGFPQYGIRHPTESMWFHPLFLFWSRVLVCVVYSWFVVYVVSACVEDNMCCVVCVVYSWFVVYVVSTLKNICVVS